jgi:hypothetical protein
MLPKILGAQMAAVLDLLREFDGAAAARWHGDQADGG